MIKEEKNSQKLNNIQFLSEKIISVKELKKEVKKFQKELEAVSKEGEVDFEKLKMVVNV